MMQFKMRRSKIGTALTITNDDSPPELQINCIEQWGKAIPRVLAMGPHAPRPFFGLKYTKTPANYPLKKLLTHYMMQIPGLEALIISPSTMRIGGNYVGLLRYVEEMNYDLAWGCHCETASGRLFVISSGLVPHILNDMKESVTMEGSQWSDNLHNWLKLILVHRYFDGNPYQIAESPVVNAYDLTPEAPQKAEEPVLTQNEQSVDTVVAIKEPKPLKSKKNKAKK